jgi:hypothetical protein
VTTALGPSGFKIVYTTPPTASPDMVNATVLGMLGVVPDLAKRLSVDLDTVDVTLRTKNGHTVSIRLERNEELK